MSPAARRTAAAALVAGAAYACAAAGSTARPPCDPAVLATPPEPDLPSDSPRLDGEFGLWVSAEPEGLAVGWITREEVPGGLQVIEADGTCREVATERDREHRVIVPVPDRGTVRLRYGSADGVTEIHETTIELGRPGRHGARFAGPDSLFVLGDVHGEFAGLLPLLRNAGLIGGDLGWTGGRSHVVLLGDFVDRGPDVTRTLWFLYRLEREAEAAGGRIHVVLGNHELMVMLGDERYTHPKELELAARYGMTYRGLFDVRRSVLGRWLASKPGLLAVDRILLAHGGVAPSRTDWTVEAFDDTLAATLETREFRRVNASREPVRVDSMVLQRWDQLLWDDESVFWYRDWVQRDDLGEDLDAVLAAFDANFHVVAHTTVPTIASLYGGRVIAVDVEAPATEMLLLERAGTGLRRWRISRGGPPEPLE